MINRQSIFVRFILFTAFIISLLLSYIYLFQYIPSQERLLQRNLFDKLKILVQFSKPSLVKAITSKDDILLLSQVENIANIEDINTAYILDNNEKVIMHNKTSEWGTVYNDEIYKTAVSKKDSFIQKTKDAKGYLFSMPITSSATLCISVSLQKANETLAVEKKEAFYTALIIFVVASALFILFMHQQILSGFIKLEQVLKSMALGGSSKLPGNAIDEFNRITSAFNDVLAKYESDKVISSEKITGTQDGLKLLLQEVANQVSGGILVIDFDNRVVSINGQALEILSLRKDNYQGKHLLDVIQMPEVLSVVKESSSSLNKPVERVVKGIAVKALTLGDAGNKVIGTVVTFTHS